MGRGKATVALSLVFMTLGLYLLRVARWHLGPRPVLIAGAWDLAWLLLGASGLLIVEMPLFLNQLHERWRPWGVSRVKPGLLASADFWHLVFVGYFLVVVGLVALELWHRLKITHIYNIRAGKLPHLLARAIDLAGLKVERDGLLFRISAEGVTPLYRGEPFSQPVRLTLKTSPWWAYGQLRWSRWNHPARAQVEKALEHVAARHRSRRETAGTLLLTASTFLLVFSSGLSVLTTVGVVRPW